MGPRVTAQRLNVFKVHFVIKFCGCAARLARVFNMVLFMFIAYFGGFQPTYYTVLKGGNIFRVLFYRYLVVYERVFYPLPDPISFAAKEIGSGEGVKLLL